MTTAALYDIHGNLPALEAVVAEARQAAVEDIVVGGDVVPGPMPREALECLLELDMPVRFLRGNGETAVLAEVRGLNSGVPAQFREAVRWTATQLSPALQRVIESWPRTIHQPGNSLSAILFCHATPRSEVEIFTRSTSDSVLRPIFDGLGVGVVVCGHTHMQFDRLVGATRVVNAGSVGMPFGAPGAHWLLLGEHVELRRTSYDLEAAAARIRATAYPHAEQFAVDNVLHCPSESDMLAAFARAEVR